MIFAIVLLIAAPHIASPARQARGTWHDLYYSYFSDLALPFGFLLPALRQRNAKPGLASLVVEGRAGLWRSHGG